MNIVELINERAAKIMEEGGTTEKVINVKAISKAEAIEMAIEQLVKEGLIKAPTMTPSERREKLAKARRKTGVFTPKAEPMPEPEPPVDENTLKRRERLAAIRAKRGAEAKQPNPKRKTLKLTGKKKPTDVDIDFLPANLRGKKIPTGGDYDDFARKAMNEQVTDNYEFIKQYMHQPYWFSSRDEYPEVNKDLNEILRLVYAHSKGAEIDSKGQVITNEADINGVRIRENDWVRVTGSWSDSENRIYRVEPLSEYQLKSQLKQFHLQPIKQDGTDSKAHSVEWPMWNSHHSKLEDQKAYHDHNKANLKIEIIEKNPVESKATPRYTATKDGIYLPDKTYVPVYYHNGIKDGEPIEVSAREYDGNLLFLQTDTDIVVNNSDGMTDYFEKDRITVTKDNPLYDIVRLGALKSAIDKNAWSAKYTLDNARREEKRLQKIFDLTKQPQDSLNLLQATKTAKAAEKAYNDKLNESENLKREIAKLERKIKGGTAKQKQETKPVDAKVLKRRERLAAIRAKYGIKPAQESPKGKKLRLYKPVEKVDVISDSVKFTSEYEIVKKKLDNKFDSAKITSSKDLYQYFLKVFPSDIGVVESFYVLFLNNQLKVVGWARIGKGGINQTAVDIRVVLKYALELTSNHIAVAHNHPSGNLTPSPQDLDLTRKLNEACKIMNITLIDHLIITPDEYYSFGDVGRL